MIYNVKSDSRRVVKGDIFVALKTPEGDGHLYIDKAIEKGASKIIAMYGNYSVETLIVDDTRTYIADYLEKTYKKYLDEMKLIGITGTNGKTTTTHFIYKMFNASNIKCASIGTLGFYLSDRKIESLPNSTPDICEMYEFILRAYENGDKVVVLEASSQGLAYRRLDKIKFDYAIFTNLTREHFDFHLNIENYCKAKQILFDSLKENGIAIINCDDQFHTEFLREKNILFGTKKCENQITNIKQTKNGIYFNLDKEYYLRTIGEYNVYNVVPAIILSKLFCITNTADLVSKLDMPVGRLESIPYKKSNIYIDYAHTADGIEKVINAVREVTDGKVYTLFSCRGGRDKGKRSEMTKTACKLSDLAIITEEQTAKEEGLKIIEDMTKDLDYSNYKIIVDRVEGIHYGISLLKEKDVLLILGRGHETSLLKDGVKTRFVEQEIVKEYIEQN